MTDSLIQSKLVQAIITALAGLVLGGGGALRLGDRELINSERSAIGAGVADIIMASTQQQAKLLEELSECHEQLKEHE